MSDPYPYNAALDLVDRHLDEGRESKPAFIDDTRQITFGELAVATRRVANVLDGLGVARETRIAVLMLDTVDWPAVFVGAMRTGVVPVALNTLLTTDQYKYMLSDSRSQVLFVSEPLLQVVEPVLAELPFLKHVIVVGGDAGNHTSFETLMASAGDTHEAAQTSSDEVAFWLYSSGSTGQPKGVMHVHSSLMDTARTYGAGTLGISESDVCFSAAKFFFAYGLGNSLTFPLSVGATTVLLSGRPTPQAVQEKLHAHGATMFFGVPTLYAAMLADSSCTPETGSAKLAKCISAGEALPAEVSAGWHKRFGVEIWDGIGSTEMLHIFLSNGPGGQKRGTTGKAVPGYELRLVGEKGEELPAGEIGELLVCGASCCNGYWNKRDKTRSTFEGLWARTGDKYIRDEDGFYQYCGRTDDMFKVSGIWVSPFEVESALVSHAAVLEAAVVAHEDDEGLIKPKAFVVLNDGYSGDGLFDELKDHVKAEAGPWKYPRWIEFLTDLPKTATGKIQRFKLRA
ncbi:benzoate-CoA ligase family protein [Anderseniella sp. Alg231-50]|uniref:benzoate-CoA ligase family protein n=1 Tax=Anderseniella sp. Alg231-50 TaxID=1922226 RepID=UPI000D556C93